MEDKLEWAFQLYDIDGDALDAHCFTTYLGDSPLHDQEIWIVNIKLHTLKQAMNLMLLNLVAIDQILRDIREGNLSAK